VPDLLAGPESRFSFFNGLGATSMSTALSHRRHEPLNQTGQMGRSTTSTPAFPSCISLTSGSTWNGATSPCASRRRTKSGGATRESTLPHRCIGFRSGPYARCDRSGILQHWAWHSFALLCFTFDLAQRRSLALVLPRHLRPSSRRMSPLKLRHHVDHRDPMGVLVGVDPVDKTLLWISVQRGKIECIAETYKHKKDMRPAVYRAVWSVLGTISLRSWTDAPADVWVNGDREDEVFALSVGNERARGKSENSISDCNQTQKPRRTRRGK
jgi:hypothetical protein